MRSRRYLATIALALPFVLAALGCVDNEPLPVANGSLTVHVAMEPVAGAREDSNPAFLYGRGMIASLLLMPLDSRALETWGEYGVEYVSAIQVADMITVSVNDLDSLVIPHGSYRLVSVTFNNFDWNVVATDPLLDPGKGKCDTATGKVTSVSMPVTQIDGSMAFAPDGDFFVTVPEDGPGSLTMVIDGAALTAAVDERVSCVLLPSGVWDQTAVFTGELYPTDIAQFILFR